MDPARGSQGQGLDPEGGCLYQVAHLKENGKVDKNGKYSSTAMFEAGAAGEQGVCCLFPQETQHGISHPHERQRGQNSDVFRLRWQAASMWSCGWLFEVSAAEDIRAKDNDGTIHPSVHRLLRQPSRCGQVVLRCGRHSHQRGLLALEAALT